MVFGGVTPTFGGVVTFGGVTGTFGCTAVGVAEPVAGAATASDPVAGAAVGGSTFISTALVSDFITTGGSTTLAPMLG